MKRQNLSQAVGEALLTLLREGEWSPGDKLPAEADLMVRFGVGRNALREGVQGLVRMGVLDVRPGVGTTVLSIEGEAILDRETFSLLLSEHALDELYELRILLEVDAAGKAAERASARELSEIAEQLDLYQSAAEYGHPTYGYDVAFHRAIAQASGNTLFPAILDLTVDRLVSSRRATDSVPSAVALAREQHPAIYAAIVAGDAAGARQIMMEHIEAGREALREWIRREQTPNK